MKVECLDYREVPGQNPLYLNYLYDFDRVADWYPAHLTGPESLCERAARMVSAGRDYPRAALVESLQQFNRQIRAGTRAMENILRLAENDTLAVVTGQQVGLLGGPALGVYKALTAVGLCRLLEKEGVKAVPVFWLASDDSDFQEVATTVLLDEKGQLLELGYDRGIESSVMAGTVSLAGIEVLLERMERVGVRGMFKASLLEELRKCYSPETSFRHGFGAWMASLFREQGLVLHDALSPGLKPYLRGAFAKAVEHHEDLLSALETRSQEVREASLPPQVQVDRTESFLFLLDSDRRYKLDYGNEHYVARDEDGSSWNSKELLELISGRPERLGPSALLRPILQDHLFPTLAYVGGPAEIAYFAQVNAIAPFWNIETAVVPRAGVTIVDAKAQRLLDKYGLKVRDIIGGSREGTRDRLVRDSAAGAVIARFDHLKSQVQSSVSSIEQEIRGIDPTISDLFRNSEVKVQYQLGKVRERFIRNYARQSSDLDCHVSFLHNSLYPRSFLQERLLNFNHFLTLYGPPLIEQLLGSLEPFCSEHQILYVSTS
jgi:bacillithiol synthase